MKILKESLLKKLEVEKTVLENDLVLHANKNDLPYEEKLNILLNIFHRMGEIENQLLLVHTYFKETPQYVAQETPETEEKQKE